MPLGTSVARLVSFSVVWGAFMLAHLRRRNNRLSSTGSGESLDRFDTDTANEVFPGMDENASLDPVVCPLPQDPPNSTLPAGTSLLRRAWSALGGIIVSAPKLPSPVSPEDQAYSDSIALVRSIATSLGLQSPTFESSYSRLPFIRSTTTELTSLANDLEVLTFYSKFYALLKAISQMHIGVKLLQDISQKMQSTAIKVLSSDARFSSESLAEFSSDVNLLMCLDSPPTYGGSVLPSVPQNDQFRQFGYCQLQFASFLSNFSVLPESVPLLSQECLQRWLTLWSMSQDIRLQLLVAKLQSNLMVHVSRQSLSKNKEVTGVQSRETPTFYLSETYNPSPTSVGIDEPVIFGPDIFKLDLRDCSSPPAAVDVIFINGMLGSVFHTWRQHDLAGGESELPASTVSAPLAGEKVKCWPRAWLSKEFPQARILGVNANLKPFVWNPMCPADRINRRIDQRAQDILQQLVMAGVGQRPIIWISHSAGGILTKEILRISATGAGEMLTPTELSPVSRPASQPDGLASNTSPYNSLACSRQLPVSMPMLYTGSATGNQKIGVPEKSVLTKSSVSTRNKDPDHAASAESEDSVTGSSPPPAVCSMDGISSQTCGIVFLSTPHRGNYSLMFLYHFPMFFALTPEARQLRQSKHHICSRTLMISTILFSIICTTVYKFACC
uniref:Protein SERAC1 n=1 Tax=Schistocephalus solidus TaxID=70667 RepID=A0A0X3PL00_SCHSO